MVGDALSCVHCPTTVARIGSQKKYIRAALALAALSFVGTPGGFLLPVLLAGGPEGKQRGQTQRHCLLARAPLDLGSDCLTTISPAEAIVSSTDLQDAATALLQLMHSESGEARWAAFMEGAITQLEDVGSINLDGLLDLSTPGDEAAVRKAAALLTLGSQEAHEVEVVSGASGDFVGRWQGIEARCCLESGGRGSGWGQWSAFALARGPESIVGNRLVACLRASGESPFTLTGQLSVQPGDRLFLACAARAAILEMAMFDRLPECAQEHADLLTSGSDEVLAPPEMIDAARFVKRLENMPGAAACMEARLQRLKSMPMVEELLLRAKADPRWCKLMQATAPWHSRLYTAARKAMLAMAPTPSASARRQLVVRGPVIELLLFFVVLAAAIFAIWTWTHQPAPTALPNYSLTESNSLAARPLLSGTPWMIWRS